LRSPAGDFTDQRRRLRRFGICIATVTSPGATHSESDTSNVRNISVSRRCRRRASQHRGRRQLSIDQRRHGVVREHARQVSMMPPPVMCAIPAICILASTAWIERT
jgi:hypothetical protein